ncbi:MAG: CehA/McbA family metallohydrolase [Verrucomicrobiales bacterium]|nr:CehA/McbA family metallohydrolase [Verrucomicrobiales bacterium]
MSAAAWSRRLWRTALLGAFLCGAGMAAEPVSLSGRVRLGVPGQFEWESFKDHPAEAERLELRFSSAKNAAEQTLRIWQRDVKRSWPVLLNGKKLGTLTTAESALECVLPVPADALQDGENVLTIEPPKDLDDIEVGPIFLDARPVAEAIAGAELKVTLVDADSDAPIPCRLTLTRKDGTLQPLRAEPVADVAVRVGVVYARQGAAVLSAPPGEYVLHAGRGFEWGVDRAEVTLHEGANDDLRLSIRREVDTRDWIAADSHIHTLTHSGHGDATLEERMLTIAGEGIELAIATDHNHHTDYAPAAASMKVSEAFTSVVGNEVTTPQGHFNAFPIEPGAAVPDFKITDWSKLLPAIRATPGVEVVTLNHPRDVHSGFIPLGGLQFNPRTGRHRQDAVLDQIDAMEVITSAAMQSDLHQLYRDWFALLNRGHRIAAIASSDTHDVSRFILGQGRTYVAVEDTDPARIDRGQVWKSYQQGRLLVSLGLMVTMTVNERFTVGDLATDLGETMAVEVVVQGPAWTQADRVELYANGVLIREQAVRDDHRAGEKARLRWELPTPRHDVHLVAIATGPGVTEPYWEIPRPYQPSSKALTPRVIGSTNPVWIDADGDGAWQSAFAIARGIVEKAAGDPAKLRSALKNCDSAVALQAESLLPK